MQRINVRTIHPYRDSGTWVFDDSETGLVKEPFVDGVPEVLESVIGTADRFSVDFSDERFLDAEHLLIAIESYVGGQRYRHEQSGRIGWLCPALFLYFDQAPSRIYARFYNLATTDGEHP